VGLVVLILLACTGPANDTAAVVDSAPDLAEPADSDDPGPDVDGDGFTLEQGDCDDWSDAVNPGANELPDNRIDDDCDGVVDELGLAYGRLILSEVLVTSSGVPDHQGEWLELANLSDGVLELDGLVVQSGELSVGLEGHVAAGSWFVLGAEADGLENGGVSVDFDYSYGTFNLGSGVLVASVDGEELDRVALSLFDLADGVSLMRRSGSVSAEWCESTAAFGSGDLGTPGAENGRCRSDVDGDEDGYSADVDCDDDVAAVNPGAEEVWYDGVDQDCDGNDADADGDGYERLEECDDTDAAVHPGAAEVWYDGVDQDCDDNDNDADGDGWPAPADCDEGDPSVNPGALEVWDDGLDQDCDGVDEAPVDTGWPDTAPPDTGP